MKSVSNSVNFKVPSDYTLAQDGDGLWLEKSVFTENEGEIKIRVLPWEPTIAYVERLAMNLQSHLHNLRRFLDQVSSKKEYVETAHLQIDSFEFFDKMHPEFGEVIFKEMSDGKIWACAYKDGEFLNLGYDD